MRPREADVVEEEGELAVGLDDVHLHRGLDEPGGLGRHDEQCGTELSAGGVLGARDNEYRVRLVDAGDEHLVTRQDPIVAVALGDGTDPVGVRTRIASVIPNAMIFDPSASPGNHCCFWSAVPYLEMMVPQMAGDTTTSNRPQPCAASSSCTSANS